MLVSPEGQKNNIMSTVENLARLGLSLPEAPKGVGNYEAWVWTGNLVMTSGEVAWVDGVLQYPGRLGVSVMRMVIRLRAYLL